MCGWLCVTAVRNYTKRQKLTARKGNDQNSDSNSPTTLASWSVMNFCKASSALSSTEAGPACFLRKLTIPSTEGERRADEWHKHKDDSNNQIFVHFKQVYTQLNHIRVKYLQFWDHHRDQIPLRPWRSSGSGSHWHHICCMCCCWMCSQPITQKGKENHSLSKEAHTQYRVQRGTPKWTKLSELHYAIPWPERRCLSDVWRLPRTRVLAFYNGHTWGTEQERTGEQVTLQLYSGYNLVKILREI